jgi:hypothetical protein
MAPPPGRLGNAMKLPVQVWMFPAEIAAVDACVAALSQQSYGGAFSRTEALRIAAMEWLKERQASHTGVTPAPPPRAPAARPERAAATALADPEYGPRPNTRVTSRHLASGHIGRQISGSLVHMRNTPLAGMYATPLMAATRDRALDIGSLGTGLCIS